MAWRYDGGHGGGNGNDATGNGAGDGDAHGDADDDADGTADNDDSNGGHDTRFKRNMMIWKDKGRDAKIWRPSEQDREYVRNKSVELCNQI